MLQRDRLFFILIFLLSACVGVGTKSDSLKNALIKVDKYQSVATMKYGEEIAYDFNATGNYVLCFKESKKSSRRPQISVQFFVYDLLKDSILYEESIADGKVKWYSDFEVEVTLRTEVAMKHHSNHVRYLYDLKTGEKKKLESSN